MQVSLSNATQKRLIEDRTATQVSAAPDTAEADRWTLAFFVLGLGLRVVSYLLRFPLRGDESRLAVHFIGSTYSQLAHPLDHTLIAPVPFLWAELFFVRLFGFNELSLRLWSFLVGIASMALFYHVARRVLRGSARVFAVGVFAVALPVVRYSVEIKPYGGDLFAGLVLLTLAIEWWQGPSSNRYLWLLVTTLPLMMWLSFPAVFVAGGISLGLLLPVWQRRDQHHVWQPYLVFNGLLVVCFFVLLLMLLGPQYHSVEAIEDGHWSAAFPPMNQPLGAVWWIVRTFTGEIMAYPVGGGPGGGAHAMILLVIGAIALWRTQWRWLTITIASMFLLGFIGAALHRYPMGRHPRITLYLAPLICLGMGVGLHQIVSWFSRPQWRARLIRGVRWTLCGIGAAQLFGVLAWPYANEQVAQVNREFARWFWKYRPNAPQVYVDFDVPARIYPSENPPLPYCYRAMFADHDQHWSDRLDQPVRCLLVHVSDSPRNDEAYRAWMADMLSSRVLNSQLTYQVPFERGGNHRFYVYDVYEFAPKSVRAAN